MKRLLVSLVALTASISAASAADLWIDPPPAPAPVTAAGYDWSGFYAGVFAGYGIGRATSTNVVTGALTNIDLDGGLLGVTAGANAQFDSFVLGVEGDIAWSGIDGSAVCATLPAYTCNGRLEWLGSAKLRAGVALDNVLIFATGGAAGTRSHAAISPNAPGLTGSFDTTAWGWTIGGGAEVALTDAISVKAEYAYYDFGTVRAPGGTLSGNPVDLTAKVHTVKAGVNYHF